MNESDIDSAAKLVWEYHHMKHELKQCDAILVLCSIDERVGEYAADLFLKGFGKWLILSGGIGHAHDLLKVGWEGSEAEHFAGIAVEKGVPSERILIENKSTNTGENIRFTYQLIKEKGLPLQSLLLVQKPYMERRTYATFMKQWPENMQILVTSPPVLYDEYFNEANPKDVIVNIMVGDMQRIREYPKLEFQIEQEIPENVWQAYERLVAAGYDKHLIA
ncbi:MAG TPA: YdcF family protein [Candidatus Limnocylindrales bacterium]|nr:YdcF family protein [Candidatus Limnocylindrales bacterium]